MKKFTGTRNVKLEDDPNLEEKDKQGYKNMEVDLRLYSNSALKGRRVYSLTYYVSKKVIKDFSSPTESLFSNHLVLSFGVVCTISKYLRCISGTFGNLKMLF